MKLVDPNELHQLAFTSRLTPDNVADFINAKYGPEMERLKKIAHDLAWACIDYRLENMRLKDQLAQETPDPTYHNPCFLN